MSWLTDHPWVRLGKVMNVGITVYRVGPYRLVTLPSDIPPSDLVTEIKKRTDFIPGKSAIVLALESGLPPEESDLLAVVGKKANLWSLWPEFGNPLWKIGLPNQFPILN